MIMPETSTLRSALTRIDGGITAPLGFASAAVHCGIKAKPGALDLAVVVADQRVSAAGLFTTAKLPLGDATQSFDDYVHQLSATTGMPTSYCRTNAQKIHRTLDELEVIIDGLTRGFDLGILDRGYAVIALVERMIPYRDAWLRSHGDVAVDGAWLLTNGAAYRLLEPPMLAAAAIVGGWLSESVGLGLWPASASLAGQLVAALVVAELFEYWAHRFMHETDFLWRFHAVHHSAPRLYWLNAVRFHPVDYVLLGICKLVPLALLGAPVEVMALVNVFSAVHGSFKHSNVPVRLGPLNWVFSMAELHRWHHSRDMREAKRNYGGNLAIWDVAFGTRFLPADREPPIDVGLADQPHFPMGYLAQWIEPFRRGADAR